LHILQLATLHFLPCMFFLTLINFCIVFYAKKNIKMENKIQRRQNKCNRKCKKNATSNVALSELHFFATCDVAFS
jgi:biopolymer transport protein ExbB/TolQ